MEDNSGGTPNPLNPNPTVGQNPEPTDNLVEKSDTSATNMNNTGKVNSGTMSAMSRGTSIDGMGSMPRRANINGMNSTPRMNNVSRTSSVPRMDSTADIPRSFDANGIGSANNAINMPGAIGVVTSLDGTPDQSTMAPMSRPMEHAPGTEPPKPRKRKNTGLIVGLLVSLFIAVGCGVAAILLFINNGKEDAVAAAMSKLVSGNMPENVIIDGTIDLNINDTSSPFSSAQINLNTEAVAKSMINSTKANLTANLRNGGSFSVEFDEVYAANGDLYLKIDGISNVLKDPNILTLQTKNEETITTENTAENSTESKTEGTTAMEKDYEEIDCYIAEGCPNNDDSNIDVLASLAATLEMLEMIDGEWIRVSINDVGSLVPSADNNDFTCLANLASEITNSNNTLGGIYSKNPFITSTSENLKVASEKNPIYLITINNDNLRLFLSEVQNSTIVSNYNSCRGQKNAKLDIDGIINGIDDLPDFYVEIDGDHNFTRIYFETDFDKGNVTVKTNLNLSYPTNVNVPEPVNYKDLPNLVQETIINDTNSQTNTAE